MIACKRKTVDFVFSPDTPRAGESVHFSNQSSDGEEWMWDFGDGSSSTLRSPSHTFRRADTYIVTLKVDGKATQTRSKKVVVMDTIPNFVLTDTTQQQIFRTLTFKAQIYNPYNYAIQYQWSVADGAEYVPISSTNQGSNYVLYFCKPGQVDMQLQVVIQGDTTTISHSYTISDRPAPVLLMQTASTSYGQRIFGTLAETPRTLWYTAGQTILDATDETVQTYNGLTFTIASLSSQLPGIQGFYITNRRIYYRTDQGLFVANLEGGNQVTICDQPVHALSVDVAANRLYWAVDEGIRFMPLVGSENNRFDTERIQTLNTISGVQRLAIDNQLR